jgi:hypothetical protein
VYSKKSIAELAYQLWNARGRPHGSEEDDWLEAERQLTTAPQADRNGGGREDDIDDSLKDTFPASDPPASHIPDLPPSNAADKWSAAGKAPRSETQLTLKASAPKSSGGPTAAEEASNPPVDETDDGPETAPGDTGED